MIKHLKAAPILLALIAHGFNCNTNNIDFAPGDQPPLGLCTLTGDLISHATLAYANTCDFASGTTPCSCEDYGGELPENLLNAAVTATKATCLPYYENCFDGCNWDTDFMWYDCSQVAEATGQVAYAYHTPSKDNPGDHDRVFDLCPMSNTMFIDPFNGGPMDIRAGESFIDGNEVIGRIHVEVQDCRYYDGNYTFTRASLGMEAGPDITEPARPATGDWMSAAGDWITDNGVFHGGHTELHEARFIARVRPDNDKRRSLILASGFFMQDTRQENQLHLDVFPPPAEDTSLTKLVCKEVIPQIQDPSCPTKPGVRLIEPPNDPTRCILDVVRGLQQAALPNWLGCWESCNSGQGPAFREDPLAYCADNIHYTGTFQAEWVDPADLWMCQCSCDDPSAPGATIAAPVQGCAQMGLDPSKPEDQQIACAQVCGGQICGAAPACRIGECHAPASGGTAQLIARSVCDPALPQPIARVSASGDYHVTIDPALSSIEYHVGDGTATSTLDGTLHFNINDSGAVTLVDFAESRFFPDDFQIFQVNITQSTLVASSRVLGQFANNSTFLIPESAGSFGAQGLIDGTMRGQDVLNPQPLTGFVDMQTRQFAIDIVAENSEGESEEMASVVAHLVGTIDNIPPVAVSGGPARTVECSSSMLTPVTLDGSQSFDSDPGDSITHYQWFTTAGAGMGNQAVVSTALPLGHSGFVLHVYDNDLGSSAAPLDINVIDSIAPALTLAPESTCVWPPDHKRIRFRLGTDVTATATDACDSAPTVRIINVTSSQPDNFPGDGNTENDASFSDHAFCIRRERTPQLGERIYSVTIEARDASGNTTTQVLPIHVAVSHNGSSCPAVGTVIAENAPCE